MQFKRDAQDPGREILSKSVKFLLFKSMFDVHRQQDLKNSKHYVTNVKDMGAFFDIGECVRKRRGHRNIFCSAVTFAFRGVILALA